jgi:hypothetical protein
MSRPYRTSRTDEHGRAFKGSQRQIQTWVNQYTEDFSDAITSNIESLSGHCPILTWVSPLKSERYVEYYDKGFLKAVNLAAFSDQLAAFWPRGGPTWDALAVAELTDKPQKQGVVLVEAKSHLTELCSTGCRAEGASLKQVKEALSLTRQWLGVPDKYEDRWLGPFYQTANRLAFLYFLQEVIKVPAWLVNIYFMDDPYRPTSKEQWEGFLPEVKWTLGLSNIKSAFVTDIYVCVEPEKMAGEKPRE